jgi:hypothetical protein
MKFKTTMAGLMATAVLGGAVLPAIPVAAQSSHHRQQTKNNWRNAAIGAGALGVAGLLTHNSTLAIVGGAGSLYSLSRYEHDRKSQSRIDHDRAAMYGRSSFTRNGHRYQRRLVTRNGHKYYTFERR